MDWDGWIDGAFGNINQCRSPNFNQRPCQRVDLIVIHCISLPEGEYGGPWVQKLFLNELTGAEHPSFADLAGVQVSAHFVISRSGELTQFVSCCDRAWHAGLSMFDGRDNCNDFSIGIELEGCDSQPYEQAQYQCLTQLVKTLQMVYPAITNDRIVGHEHIAPGRKTDPGPYFAWHEFKDELESR